MMTLAQRRGLEQLLAMHRDHLRSALARPDRFSSGIHGLVAIQLRVLLCDKDFPLLLKYADEKMVNLYVYGPVQTDAFDQQHTVVHWTSCVIGRKYWSGAQPFDIHSYLDCIIQTVASIGGKWEDPGDTVTPRKLIKWVANKDGFAHFDLHKPRAFDSFKTWVRVDSLGQTDEFMIKECLFQIAGWVVEIIDAVRSAKVGAKIA